MPLRESAASVPPIREKVSDEMLADRSRTSTVLASWGRPAIVFVSSHDAASYRRRLQRSPARGFIPKAELSGERLAALLE